MDRLPFTEREFVAALKADGFLTPLLDIARPQLVEQNKVWFAHAQALNNEGLKVLERREHAVVGKTTHHSLSIATRLMIRAMNSFQGTVRLLEYGMAIEGNVLARGLYEIAFWLGFLNVNPQRAVEEIRDDELRSQKSRTAYYIRQVAAGILTIPDDLLIELRDKFSKHATELKGKKPLNSEELARRGDLSSYYESYKHLSAASAHVSLNSLHNYLKINPDGTYDGHVWGPDVDGVAESMSLGCIAIGVSLALYATIVSIDDQEAGLRSLLLKTDELRKAQG